MNDPIKITASVSVWLSSCYTVHELLTAIKEGNGEKVAEMTLTYGPPEKDTFSDLSKAGIAEITYNIFPRDQLTRAQIATLHNELEQARLAFASKQAEILERISKVQALEFSPEAA